MLCLLTWRMGIAWVLAVWEQHLLQEKNDPESQSENLSDLFSAHPNLFTDITTITFSLLQADKIKLYQHLLTDVTQS